jgi:hypothetical protein
LTCAFDLAQEIIRLTSRVVVAADADSVQQEWRGDASQGTVGTGGCIGVAQLNHFQATWLADPGGVEHRTDNVGRVGRQPSTGSSGGHGGGRIEVDCRQGLHIPWRGGVHDGFGRATHRVTHHVEVCSAVR